MGEGNKVILVQNTILSEVGAPLNFAAEEPDDEDGLLALVSTAGFKDSNPGKFLDYTARVLGQALGRSIGVEYLSYCRNDCIMYKVDATRPPKLIADLEKMTGLCKAHLAKELY